MTGRWRGVVVALTLASVVLTGCFGKFTLVRGLYQFNKQVEDKFVRSLVFDVMVILPVYEVAGLIDWAVLNVIEFWTGKNPVVIKTARFGDDQFVQTVSRTADGALEIRIDRRRDDRLVETLDLRQSAESGIVHADRRVFATGASDSFEVVQTAEHVTIAHAVNGKAAITFHAVSHEDIAQAEHRVARLVAAADRRPTIVAARD